MAQIAANAGQKLEGKKFEATLMGTIPVAVAQGNNVVQRAIEENNDYRKRAQVRGETIRKEKGGRRRLEERKKERKKEREKERKN